jgi:putative transposase
MARLARIIVPGLPHHVTHRGNRRDDVFLEDGDREAYCRFLSDCAAKAKLDIWGYCLMTNHVHLIVAPQREDSLARGVGLAHRRYAVWLNKRKGWSGHLWANRYFSTPLDEAHHWAAMRYVERNPVRARLVGAAAEYRWSSARAHVCGAADALLAPDSPYPGPVPDWGQWLLDPEEESAERIRRCTKTGRPCGGPSFVADLERTLGRLLHPAKRGPKPQSQMQK